MLFPIIGCGALFVIAYCNLKAMGIALISLPLLEFDLNENLIPINLYNMTMSIFFSRTNKMSNVCEEEIEKSRT